MTHNIVTETVNTMYLCENVNSFNNRQVENRIANGVDTLDSLSGDGSRNSITVLLRDNRGVW